jgi:cytochrome c oxidase subunit 4
MTDAHPASHAEHGHHHVNYMAIFIALCVCTVLSWLADQTLQWGLLSSRRIVAVLVLAVAVAKAQFVMRYFMHLKFEGRWKFVLLLPTAILACGIPLALAPDIGLHYYTPSTPQARMVAPAAEHGGAAEEAEHPATGTEGGESSGGGGGH